MKLTTDYDRDQQSAFRRRNRLAAQAQETAADKCPCEVLAERIVAGESPAQLHRWVLHSQAPRFRKQLEACLCPAAVHPSSQQQLLLGGVHQQQFSHSATQPWPAGGSMASSGGGGQFGQYSFDSLERSKVTGPGQGGCEHRPLFMALMGAEKPAGLFTLLQSWGISLAVVRDRRGQGPLHWAAQRQLLNVNELLQLVPAAEVLAQDRKGVTPVHLAAAHRSARVLKLLLDALASSSRKDDEQGQQLDQQQAQLDDHDGMNPLHHAAAAGSEQCCELLMAGPVWRLPVDLRDNFGRTPLHLAAWSRKGATVARRLMAKKSIAATARDHQGLTPLHIAVMANNRPVLETLLEGMTASGGGAAQVFDHDSRTPLHYAALYDRADLARLLVAAGASNDTRDRRNVTPAHYAAQSASYETFVAVLAESEERQPVDSEGRTPFMWAVIGQNLLLVSQMLANRAEAGRLLAVKDHFRRNCLHLAALSGGLEMCKLLAEEGGVLVNSPDENGATPEHLAAGQGNSELVLWFGYQRGHLPSPLDEMDRTPFFYCCLGGQVSTAEAMLRSLHIDPGHVDQLGRTALHCAVVSGSLNCVKALVESNLNFEPELLDNSNKRATDLAREQKCVDIVNYLGEERMAVVGVAAAARIE